MAVSCSDNSSDNKVVLTDSAASETTLEISPEDEMIESIKVNLDILAKNDPDDLVEENGIIDDVLFDEIVAYGEDALPFLKEIADRSVTDIKGYEDPNEKIEQRRWAVHAIYKTDPDFYDIIVPSPNGKYSLKIPVDSFWGVFNRGQDYKDITLIEISSNKIILSSEMKNYFEEGVLYPKVNWSEDSRFVVIDCSGRHCGEVQAIDVQAMRNLFLPGIYDILEYIFPTEEMRPLDPAIRFWFEFKDWESERIAKIDFVGITVKDRTDISGWYTYDLLEEKILDLDYEFDVY